MPEAAALEQRITSLVDPSAGWKAFAARALDVVTRAVGGDTWCVAAVDPRTLLMTDVVAAPGAQSTPRFFELEYGARDYLAQRDLGRGRKHAGALSIATRGKPQRSARWRELIEPFGFDDQLRAALVTGSGCWGYVGIERARGSSFSAKDVAVVASLTRVLGDGIRASLLAERSSPRSSVAAAGYLVVDDGLRVVSSDQVGDVFEEPIDPGRAAPTPAALLAARLRATGDASATASIRSRGSWITLAAWRTPLPGGGAHTTVVAHPARAEILDILCAAYRFTRRETEIVRLVLHGSGTPDIARTLHIAELTVQQHLKSVFVKADVGSRRELVARFVQHFLFDAPASPHAE